MTDQPERDRHDQRAAQLASAIWGWISADHTADPVNYMTKLVAAALRDAYREGQDDMKKKAIGTIADKALEVAR